MHRLIRVHVSERVLCIYLLGIHTRYCIKPFLIRKSHWLVGSWLMPGSSYPGVTWQSKSTTRGSNLPWVLLGHFPREFRRYHTHATRVSHGTHLPATKSAIGRIHSPYIYIYRRYNCSREEIEIRILLLYVEHGERGGVAAKACGGRSETFTLDFSPWYHISHGQDKVPPVRSCFSSRKIICLLLTCVLNQGHKKLKKELWGWFNVDLGART